MLLITDQSTQIIETHTQLSYMDIIDISVISPTIYSFRLQYVST